MKVALGTGVANAAVWLTWCLRNWRPYTHKAFVFFVLLHAFAVFEVFDFPPWRQLIDAHAVWHAGTIPLSFLWYSFLQDDAAFEAAAATTSAHKAL